VVGQGHALPGGSCPCPATWVMSRLSQTVDEPMVYRVPESHFLDISAGHGPASPGLNPGYGQTK
jgi:hypothetical protein